MCRQQTGNRPRVLTKGADSEVRRLGESQLRVWFSSALFSYTQKGVCDVSKEHELTFPPV